MWKQCFIIGPSYAGEVDIIRYNIRIIRYHISFAGIAFPAMTRNTLEKRCTLIFGGQLRESALGTECRPCSVSGAVRRAPPHCLQEPLDERDLAKLLVLVWTDPKGRPLSSKRTDMSPRCRLTCHRATRRFGRSEVAVSQE